MIVTWVNWPFNSAEALPQFYPIWIVDAHLALVAAASLVLCSYSLSPHVFLTASVISPDVHLPGIQFSYVTAALRNQRLPKNFLPNMPWFACDWEAWELLNQMNTCLVWVVVSGLSSSKVSVCSMLIKEFCGGKAGRNDRAIFIDTDASVWIRISRILMFSKCFALCPIRTPISLRS